MSDERSVLDVVENIDRKLDTSNRKLDEKSKADEARFMAAEAVLRDHEHRLDEHDEKHKEHDERHRAYDRQLHDQSALLVTLGQATARAMDAATRAQQDSARTKDECVTIVESAIRMHSASISATVQDAVRSAVQPLVAKTEAQDLTLDLHTRNDEAQNIELRAQSSELRLIRSEVGAGNAVTAAVAAELGITDHVKGDKPRASIRRVIRSARWSGLGVALLAIAYVIKTAIELFKH